MNDYELSDNECPKCGASETHYRHCDTIGCEDGFIDEYETDAINFSPGESYEMCRECWGTGIQAWCPTCGADLSLIAYQEKVRRERAERATKRARP